MIIIFCIISMYVDYGYFLYAPLDDFALAKSVVLVCKCVSLPRQWMGVHASEYVCNRFLDAFVLSQS